MKIKIENIAAALENYSQPKKLLSAGTTNAKTAKNDRKTFILYLTPYKFNSMARNLCPKASAGCAAACLFSAGRGVFTSVWTARLYKTEFFLRDREGFILTLAAEIMAKVKTARRRGEKVAFRLNGTSDIDFVYMLKKYAGLDIETLADVAVFYDYTKILGKAIKYRTHPNYFVTFSRSESNHEETAEAIRQGVNVAAVFAGDLPGQYMGAPVVDGDAADDLMVEKRGVVLGLKAKGDAKKDTTGFTIQTA